MTNFKRGDGSTNRKPSTFEELMRAMTTQSNNPELMKKLANHLYKQNCEENKLNLKKKSWDLRKDKLSFIIYSFILLWLSINQNLPSYTSKLLVIVKSLI
jgi:hypothetical protein